MSLGSTLAFESTGYRVKGSRGYHWHDFRWVTEQQTRVLDLLCAGLTQSQIAKELNVTRTAIKQNLKYARERTESRTTCQLVARYVWLRAILPKPRNQEKEM